jgi:hypothetical protein
MGADQLTFGTGQAVGAVEQQIGQGTERWADLA